MREPDGRHRAVVDVGLLAPLGLSIDGFISHEVQLTASTFLGNGRAATLAHVDYEANLELGTWLLSLQLGLAERVPGWSAGWRAGIALGYVFSPTGGGTF